MEHARPASPGYPPAKPLARPGTVRNWSRGAAGLAILIGAAAFLGILVRAPWLVGATFELGTTKANTALGLMLLGTAAWMATGGRRWSIAATLPAGFAGLIGAVTLVQYITGIDLGIDRLITEPLTGTSRFPGRMPPASALSFIALSAAVILGTWRRLDGVADALTGTVFGLIVLVLFAVFYGAPEVAGLTWVTAGLAAPTAFGLTAICLAVMTRRADTGLMRYALSPGPDGALLRSLAPVLLAVPILAGLGLAWAQWTGRLDAGIGQALLVPVATMVIVVGTLIAARRLAYLDRRRQDYAVRLADANRRLLARAEDQAQLLDEQAATMQAIMTSVPDHIYVHDSSLRTRFAAPAGAHALGRSPEEMLGHAWSDLDLPRRASSEYESALRQVFEAGEIRSGRLEMPVGHRLRLLDYTVAPIMAADGSVHQVVAVMRDVTDQVAAQERDEHLHRQASESAFKTDFLNRAAHELATPMTPLIIQTQILKRHATSGRARKSVAIIERNLQRLQTLVDDLLDAGRIQSQKVWIKKRPTDLRHVLHEAIASFRPVARQKGVGLSSSLQGDLHGELDEGRLYQVISNLLSNAIKFTPTGGQVDLAARRAGAGIEIQVSDTGRGFPKEKADLLFKPFSQLHDPSSQAGRSSGLGLYISHAIVAGHNGTITGSSAGHGQGATFTVWLPAGTSKPRPARPPPRETRTARTAGSTTTRGKA